MLYAIILWPSYSDMRRPIKTSKIFGASLRLQATGRGACGAVCARSGSDHGFTSGLPFSVRMCGVATICWRADGTRHTSSPLG